MKVSSAWAWGAGAGGAGAGADEEEATGAESICMAGGACWAVACRVKKMSTGVLVMRSYHSVPSQVALTECKI